jgi:hypothetical protein
MREGVPAWSPVNGAVGSTEDEYRVTYTADYGIQAGISTAF